MTERSTEAPEPQPATPAVKAAILTAVGRQLSGSTSMYMVASSLAIPTGIVGVLIAIQYLTPAQLGQYGLLMVMAGFLSVFYNVGLLHGTFLWVYGMSGEGDGGDDFEIMGVSRAGVGSQRAAMGTGLIMTLIVVAAGTTLCFIFARPIASLLLGNPHRANLVGLAAASGGAGSIFRLTVNVFRFERRFAAFALATALRPIAILIVSSILLIEGDGVWGAVVGTALPTIGCAAVCMLGTIRNYALHITVADIRNILLRGATVVIPVIALFAAHNGDLLLLSHWVHGPRLGIYRLASRLGTPPSYFASAFLMTWGPLERSSIAMAAFNVRGHQQVRSLVNTYYMLTGFAVIVVFVLFSRVFLLLAPHTYREAAKVVPLIAVAFVAYGAYIILLRTTRPERMILWYTTTASLSAIVFFASAFVLIPAFGIYGAPLALTAGMMSGVVVILLLNTRAEDPLPIEYRRIVAGLLSSAAVSGVALAGIKAGHTTEAVATVGAAVVYLPLLVLSGAIPRDHLPLLWGIIRRDRSSHVLQISPEQLPYAEREAFAQFRAGRHGGDRDIDYARLTRALRHLGGIGKPTSDDSRIGSYLASRDPESIRDFQMNELIASGVDAYELYRLDRLAKLARRSNFDRRINRPPRRGLMHARARALGDSERAHLTAMLDAAGVSSGRRRSTSDAPLALVRALRAVRRTLGIGQASTSDLTLAQALWRGDSGELDSRGRDELRRLKAAARLAAGRNDAPHDRLE